MKISTNWLQTYFKEKLPDAEKLAHLFTFRAFEVEETQKLANDVMIDLKVLPDRAHYALSHEGIARELAAIGGLTLKEKNLPEVPSSPDLPLCVIVEEPKLCRRYIGRRVSGIEVEESPAWLRQRLDAIGQRSINSVVDATNFVMFDVGQPLHAFDADKVKGDIIVRKAVEGEKLELLPEKTALADGTVVEKERAILLKGTELVICDEDGPLALAGVKGGMRASVTEHTKNLILEAANFDPVSVRKTSTQHNVRNDSSKRFENEISPELAAEAMAQLSSLLAELSPAAAFGVPDDQYPNPVEPWTVTVTADYVSGLLGAAVPKREIEDILRRMKCELSDRESAIVVRPPYWRLDLRIPQDIAEEVGRVRGYENVKAAPLPEAKPAPINPTFYWTEKIKDMLVSQGFSEVYSYSLTDRGAVEIMNPLASDKRFVRSNLSDGVAAALESNVRNADLLGLDQVKIFEIGKAFAKEGEKLVLALGIANVKGRAVTKADQALAATVMDLAKLLGADPDAMPKPKNGVFELEIGPNIEKLPQPAEWDAEKARGSKVAYKPFSPYPFMVRDIAVFVPEGTKEGEPLAIIEKNAGDLLVRRQLFDVFEKKFPDGTAKTSYAFRMVFQSHERTLTDDEVNAIMKRIGDEMAKRPGWQVR